MGYGDELMVAGRARVMQRTDPRKVRPLFQGKPRWHPIWDGNPRIAHPDERGDFQALHARDAGNNRPYHLGKTPERWTYNLEFRPDVGEIYFSDEERAFGAQHAGRIIVEPHIKAEASPNKQWGWIRWNKLAWLLRQAGVCVTQLGPAGTRTLDGVELIVTPSFRMAAAVLAGARVIALPEGGLHHAAAALGVPGVVIFGGFTPVELTGYPVHRNFGASLEAACGMRTPCAHCATAMAAIRPEHVFNELENILERIATGGRRAHAADGSAPRGHDDPQREQGALRGRQGHLSI